MLIQFFSNGTGGGAAPVGYLIADRVLAYDENRDLRRDRLGVPMMVTREPRPEVLRGDPARTEALIDACPHKWSYRAGVISFAHEDAPSEVQQSELIEQFEELAFAGLERDQYDCLWVRHTHEDRIELHFCTPRMELSTGNSLNIAPPGYQKAFDSLRDLANKSHDWADPLEPKRLRAVRTQSEQTVRAQGREELHGWILDQVSIGAISDRASMTSLLREVGYELPRLGRDYLTVKDPETGERWRLKGEIFHDEWQSPAAERQAERRSLPTKEGERRLSKHSTAELQERFERYCEKRADYNIERFQCIPELERNALDRAAAHNLARNYVSTLDAIGGELRADRSVDWLNLDVECSDRKVSRERRLGEHRTTYSERDTRDFFGAELGNNSAGSVQFSGARSDLLSIAGVSDEQWHDRTRAGTVGIRKEVEHLLRSVGSGIARLRETLNDHDYTQVEWIGRLCDSASALSGSIGRCAASIVSVIQRLPEVIREPSREPPEITQSRTATELELGSAPREDDSWEL